MYTRERSAPGARCQPLLDWPVFTAPAEREALCEALAAVGEELPAGSDAVEVGAELGFAGYDAGFRGLLPECELLAAVADRCFALGEAVTT